MASAIVETTTTDSSSSADVGDGNSAGAGGTGDATGNKVFQFKVTLVGIDPPIWRRIQVPCNYKFWALHCTIQNSMGWNDTRHFGFEVTNPRNGNSVKIGKPHGLKGEVWNLDEMNCQDFLHLRRMYPKPGDRPDEPEEKVYASWKVPLSKYLNPDLKYQINYKYNLGSSSKWVHEIVFEGMIPADSCEVTAKCIAGEGACPPEGCENQREFNKLLVILKTKEEDRNDEQREWVECIKKEMDGKEYFPDIFEPCAVVFHSPKMWLEYKKANPYFCSKCSTSSARAHNH